MGDLRNPTLMYVKAAMFVLIGTVAAALILLETQSGKVALLLALTVWAFARAYYFVFYVIERYIDDQYRFAGLLSFLRYLMSQHQRRK